MDTPASRTADQVAEDVLSGKIMEASQKRNPEDHHGGAQKHDGERRGKRAAQFLSDGVAGAQRRAQIARQRVFEPGQVLQGQRLVKPQHDAGLVDLLLRHDRTVALDVGRRRVHRRKAHQQKRKQRNDQKCQNDFKGLFAPIDQCLRPHAIILIC
jgi:hypothetical protein